MADTVIAVGFGAPFGIAGKQPLLKQSTNYLPLAEQYGKRIRTNKELGVEILLWRGLIDYLGRQLTSRDHLYIQYPDCCLRMITCKQMTPPLLPLKCSLWT